MKQHDRGTLLGACFAIKDVYAIYLLRAIDDAGGLQIQGCSAE